MSAWKPIPIGMIFFRLTVIRQSPTSRSYYICRCECGQEKTVRAAALRAGKMKSCGCQKHPRPTLAKYGTKGVYTSSEYRIWVGMKSRCHNPKSRLYRYYGARGIRVCDRWWYSFGNFLADMGKRPTPKHSLDRRYNDGPYSPDNCRWATRIEQQNNTTKNRWIEFHGQRKTMGQWARTFNIGYNRFQCHLRDQDFDIERTLAAIRRIDGLHDEPSTGVPIAAINSH